MSRLFPVFVSFALIVLTGCTTTDPVPDDYTGPTAVIADSSANRVDPKGFLNPKPPRVDMFYAYKIDGKEVDTIASKTYRRNEYRGFAMDIVPTERDVPAKPLTVEIVGATYHAAPVGVLFGKSYSVSGTVTFKPAAGQSYVVRGTLGEDYSAVWIETAGGRVVSKKIEKRTS